jgi:hypothetical protein
MFFVAFAENLRLAVFPRVDGKVDSGLWVWLMVLGRDEVSHAA